MTYIGNVVHAHLLAGAALAAGAPSRGAVNGQAYFVTNAEPVSYWQFWGIVRPLAGQAGPGLRTHAACACMGVADPCGPQVLRAVLPRAVLRRAGGGAAV